MSKGILPWQWGGVFLALAFFCAVLLVKPIGVSTQFVIADGMVWSALDPSLITENEQAKSGYESTNAYLNKSGGKYAKSVANPLNYSFVFVLAMIFGTFLSVLLGGDKPQSAEHKIMPPVWQQRFGDSALTRYAVSFLAGFVVLFGARLAGGCTSGHMMSGMMQTALSGYIFAAGAFLVAFPVAILTFKSNKS